MKIFAPVLLLAILLPAAPAAAQQCPAPEMLNSVMMLRRPNDSRDYVTITINGSPRHFLFDTGGSLTSIARAAAQDLQLQIHGNDNIRIRDLSANLSKFEALVPHFEIGQMHGDAVNFPLSPEAKDAPDAKTRDGLYALDYLQHYDVDMDFGASDILNVYSQDHCPGRVLPGTVEPVTVVPMTQHGLQIIIPVMLDGHNVQALIDTGAANTFLPIAMEKQLFGLDLGSADAPERKLDGGLKAYEHVFKSLSFNGIAVANPHILMNPEAVIYNVPQMIIGMDVLRKLHIFMAFSERKMYISAASATPLAAAPGKIASLGQQLASKPDDAALLNIRSFLRARAKIDLDAAMADTDRADRLKPNDAEILDTRAFILYQQGKYREALAAYDVAMRTPPLLAVTFFMRGHTKGKLGDAAGMAADIATARKMRADVDSVFTPYGVDLQANSTPP
jgi:predicted aspartyl protease